MNLLVQHIPHAIPVVIVWGILIRYWLVQRRLPPDARWVAPPLPPKPPAPPPVRRTVAVRGLAALGPLLGALATGLVIYALNLGRGHAGQTAIWVHVGLSTLALLLVAYKIADIGLARLRDGLTRTGAWRTAGSLVLLALWIPLLVSGIALLVFPSEASFTAYAHLIASVWWTGLLLWHLRRYLLRAARTLLARPAPPPGLIASAPPAPASPAAPRAPRPRPTPGRRPGPSVGENPPAGEPEAAGIAAQDGASAPIPGR
jgi:hypothetical protein